MSSEKDLAQFPKNEHELLRDFLRDSTTSYIGIKTSKDDPRQKLTSEEQKAFIKEVSVNLNSLGSVKFSNASI